LFGYSGRGDRGGEPGGLGALNPPTEVVSSEYLTTEGKKFSSSRRVVLYVRDFLDRYDVDALRYYLAVAGPENQDTDFTWSEFVRRNNDELVATWGNLVNRSVSFAAKNIGEIPAAGELTAGDRDILERSRKAFDVVGAELERSRFKGAINEAMRTVAEANKYLSEEAPWKLRQSDPERMKTILHVALQLVDDAKTLLTPFLPHSSDKVHKLLGGTGEWSGMPELRMVADDPASGFGSADGDPGAGSGGSGSYPVLTGSYDTSNRWASRPIAVGTALRPPKPLFTKLDPSVVDEELKRLEDGGDTAG
jgi:methionyl-tRNA synthetase